MKRSITAVAALTMLLALPLFAGAPRLADDVIRLAQAEVSDDSIIAFVQAKREEVEVDADDIIAMSQAGLSNAVITAVIDEASVRSEAERREVRAAPPAYYTDPYPYYYGPRLHGFFGLGHYGGYGHHSRYGGYGDHGGYGHHGGSGRGWRH